MQASNTTSSQDTNFSAPWMKANLKNTSTYVGSDNFDSQLVWLKNNNQNKLMIVPEDHKEKPFMQVTWAVVGVVSFQRLFLEPHGNFNPIFEKSALENSKAQFMLISPPIDNEFYSDFQLAIEHIKNLQNKVVSTGPDPKYFLIEDGRQTGMRFSSPLFEKRDFEYDPLDEEDWSNGYLINDKYKTAFKAIIQKWRVTPLPAYDENANFIRVRDQENYLKGSMVLIYFQLRHYAIRDKDTNGITGNTFTASATQIKILQRAPKKKASPYKSQMLKGPTTLPTSPSKYKLQVEAVKAFHPSLAIRLVDPTFQRQEMVWKSLPTLQQQLPTYWTIQMVPCPLFLMFQLKAPSIRPGSPKPKGRRGQETTMKKLPQQKMKPQTPSPC
ncbi:hypothetical protein BYT27DRAFT_7261183 [Phlegmacium glaucopus]|nr:hypothetical protein BYT27DRAFT_7261183 [Phlegmacium glaucopus]